MIFTLGHRDSYHAGLAEKPRFKRGAFVDSHGQPYPGGSVWPTRSAAQHYLDHDLPQGYGTFEIFGVDADWDADTHNTGDHWNNLLKDARIIDLCETPP